MWELARDVQIERNREVNPMPISKDKSPIGRSAEPIGEWSGEGSRENPATLERPMRCEAIDQASDLERRRVTRIPQCS